jgi:hypothetical protein
MDSKEQAGVLILISEKEDFKHKIVRRDKDCHSILIKVQYIMRKLLIYMHSILA